MKRKLSIHEFKDYCEEHCIKEISFSTENQEWYKTSDPCKAQMCFRIMLISEDPSLVFLRSETGTLCFDRVRYIEVETDKTTLGTVVLVYCGGSGYSNPEITYTLIVA